ncbi:hypothetical protein FRC02_002897 [Tulasnella sp. 418]|nr:hypothetical protein FRC02_002897 [Tulasnella sp. 418]
MPPATSEQGVERNRRQYNPRGTILGRGKACNSCREKKLKCDGAIPKCASCVASDRECTYVRNVKRPIGNQSTAILETKLSTLEQRLAVLLDAPKNKNIQIPEAIRLKPSQIEPPRDESISPSPYPPPSPTSSQFGDDEQKILLDVFFSEGRRFAPFIKQERFYEQMNSADPSERPHPALLNSILLNAVGFVKWYSLPVTLPATTPSAESLVLKTQAELSKLLAEMELLLDYLQASVFLTNWFLHEGRLQEGQYTSALTARFAIACGLNKIPQGLLQEDPAFYPFMAPGSSGWDTCLLGRPKRYKKF